MKRDRGVALLVVVALILLLGAVAASNAVALRNAQKHMAQVDRHQVDRWAKAESQGSGEFKGVNRK